MEDTEIRHLINDLTNPDNQIALYSVAELRRLRVLTDGSLRGVNLERANLLHADLRQASLPEANMRRANLTNAVLTEADFSGANLAAATLWEAEMQGADLRATNLSGANLAFAVLTRADLEGADLSGATLSGATLAGARLKGADLTMAQWDTSTILPDNSAWTAEMNITRFTDPSYGLFWEPPAPDAPQVVVSDLDVLIQQLANPNSSIALIALEKLRASGALTDGSLRGVDLREAGLYQADLSGADLARADLRGANLQQALLDGANLENANLEGADLGQAKLRGATLKGANLRGTASFHWVTLDKSSMLPDGTPWSALWNPLRFYESTFPNFWRSDDPDSPAYHGG